MTPDDLMFKPDLMKGHQVLVTGAAQDLERRWPRPC